MRTVGYRKSSVGILYAVLLAVGVMIFIGGLSNVKYVAACIIGGLLALISAIVVIGFFRTPADAVQASDDEVSVGRATIKIKEISDISYRRASARGIQYKWGIVTVVTYHGTYRVNYVADCEDVAKELTRLMYAVKQQGEKNDNRIGNHTKY